MSGRYAVRSVGRKAGGTPDFVSAALYRGGMCGRYASSANPDDLVDEFDIDDILGVLPGPDFNVAPTVEVPAVLERL